MFLTSLITKLLQTYLERSTSRKNVTSNNTKHIEAEKKIIDLTNKVTQISGKGYDFLLSRMYFTGYDGYQNF